MTINRGSFATLSSDYVSPTLKMLEADRASDNPRYAIHEPEAACTSCPIAVWYLEGGRVRQGGVISAVAVGHRQAALAVMCRG